MPWHQETGFCKEAYNYNDYCPPSSYYARWDFHTCLPQGRVWFWFHSILFYSKNSSTLHALYFFLNFTLFEREKKKRKIQCQLFSCLTVSAVEQLQAMASKRQYKEAAAQLEVSHGVHKILQPFHIKYKWYIDELHGFQFRNCWFPCSKNYANMYNHIYFFLATT